ncbi:hypothetical protein CB1_000067010 [Camelus ferus]|nr:hypothetical protein CB1_000067010 [Camelus ferus]
MLMNRYRTYSSVVIALDYFLKPCHRLLHKEQTKAPESIGPRFGESEEHAGIEFFLCSSAASYVTSRNIVVAGYSSWSPCFTVSDRMAVEAEALGNFVEKYQDGRKYWLFLAAFKHGLVVAVLQADGLSVTSTLCHVGKAEDQERRVATGLAGNRCPKPDEAGMMPPAGVALWTGAQEVPGGGAYHGPCATLESCGGINLLVGSAAVSPQEGSSLGTSEQAGDKTKQQNLEKGGSDTPTDDNFGGKAKCDDKRTLLNDCEEKCEKQIISQVFQNRINSNAWKETEGDARGTHWAPNYSHQLNALHGEKRTDASIQEGWRKKRNELGVMKEGLILLGEHQQQSQQQEDISQSDHRVHSGIGFAISQHLAQDGAHVVVSSWKQQNADWAVASLWGRGRE